MRGAIPHVPKRESADSVLSPSIPEVMTAKSIANQASFHMLVPILSCWLVFGRD